MYYNMIACTSFWYWLVHILACLFRSVFRRLQVHRRTQAWFSLPILAFLEKMQVLFATCRCFTSAWSLSSITVNSANCRVCYCDWSSNRFEWTTSLSAYRNARNKKGCRARLEIRKRAAKCCQSFSVRMINSEAMGICTFNTVTQKMTSTNGWSW